MQMIQNFKANASSLATFLFCSFLAVLDSKNGWKNALAEVEWTRQSGSVLWKSCMHRIGKWWVLTAQNRISSRLGNYLAQSRTA